jgi:hypothetical protein
VFFEEAAENKNTKSFSFVCAQNAPKKPGSLSAKFCAKQAAIGQRAPFPSGLQLQRTVFCQIDSTR